MNYQIPISHELIHENVTEFYNFNTLYDYRDDFDEIISVEKVEWNNKYMLKVVGTIHLYGYDIKDDSNYSGFFDVINQRFIFKDSSIYQNATIIPVKTECIYQTPVKPRVLKKKKLNKLY